MTKQEYETEFEHRLEDMWNDSARFQYLNWDSFVSAMYKRLKESEYE